MDRVAGKLKPLEDVHFWPVAELCARRSQPYITSAFPAKAVVAPRREPRADNDPKRHSAMRHATRLLPIHIATRLIAAAAEMQTSKDSAGTSTEEK